VTATPSVWFLASFIMTPDGGFSARNKLRDTGIKLSQFRMPVLAGESLAKDRTPRE